MYKPILVTGASSGIGEATAILLAQKGFRVFAAARRIVKLKALEGLQGGRITPIALDVADQASIDAAMKAIQAEAGALFGLVNNAGVSVTGPAELVPDAEWRRQFETNVFGLMNVTRAVIPGMRAQRFGRIVNIGSVAGRIASPFMGAYAASKHAVEGLSDALRRELKPFGIKVSVVRPGFINTAFGEQEQEALTHYMTPQSPYAAEVATFKAWHAKGHPTGAPPSAVAEKVAHAMTADLPHSRYTVPDRYIPSLMLRNLAPSAVVDRVFENVIGLKR
jgi:NAD(P)-dependent dehydrogenase (short-subunit alcohol dehydrogenase family)